MSREVDRLQEYVERTGGRVTEPRRRILEEVYQADGHFSGDDIFVRLKNKGHDVSRASIFRTLPLLVEAGLLRESVTLERHRHFEHTWGHTHHEHLVCVECGGEEEFLDPYLEGRLTEIAEAHGHSARGHKVEIYGVCRNCLSSKQHSGPQPPPPDTSLGPSPPA